MSTKKQRCLSMHHDVVERILERLDVDSLMRLKGVSKQWKSTIDSPYFQRRQLTHRQQSGGDPDVLMVSVSLSTVVLGSPSSSVNIPTPWETDNTRYLVSYNSFDGLVCLYHHSKPGFVVNPTTRWYRPLPLCSLQRFLIDLGEEFYNLAYIVSSLGFGKDKITGTYKPVWLYNPSLIGLENATTTTCEVFDFSTNAWRYVTPAAPYRIVSLPVPVYVDGSLHWFTQCKETKILSLDLHTEAFQVVCKAPFANVCAFDIAMCNLDNRLCVSEMKWPNQVIWSLNSADKTWHKMCSIDLDATSDWFCSSPCALLPLALLDGKKNKKKKLFFCSRELSQIISVVLDLETESYHLAFNNYSIGFPVCYFQSLISIS